MPRRLPVALALGAVAVAFAAGPAAAVEPTDSTPNPCTDAGGRGTPCSTHSDCAQNLFATVCVETDDGAGQCEAPCGADGEAPGADPTKCSIGEVCVAGTPRAQSSGVVHYCEPQRFRVDLNLLDLCITHYLEKTNPVFSGAECSLQRNLNRLLDQNGDARFDLFDLDLCVLAFVEQRGCERDVDGALQAVDPGVRCCEEDEACGRGSYCDPSLNICQRDCGPVASREETLGSLDRQCMGALQVCDEDRGRCETVDVTDSTCQVDQDCPAGAYCFLGRCAPSCYRSTDCPDSGWYCTKTNKCRALPPPEADEGFQFVPENYAIRFVRDGLSLDAVQNADSSQLAIMDLITKRQIFGNSSVAFGYRMEITYGLKQDTVCLQPFVDCSEPDQRPPGETEIECTARQDDCLIDPSEEWIRPLSPFGMVSAAGTPSIGVELEESVADDLSPGTYSADVRLIFDNGDSDTIPVTYTKASPSGEFEGTLTVYMGTVENALNGNRPLQFGMRIKVYPGETRQWNELMASHDLDADDEGLVDITTGQLVHASLHGDSALAFTRGAAGSDVPDEVQFVGLYSPELGRLRLTGVIDIPADFRIDADGGSCDPGSAALCVRNLFGRDLRRRIEFIGPFEEGIGRFHGIYRETLFGLVPDDGVTLEGGFIMDQAVADDSPLPVDGPLGASDAVFEFPTVTADDVDATAACSGLSTAKVNAALADFGAYIDQAERGGVGTPDNPFGRTTIFPDLVQFRDAIEMALGALDSGSFEETGDPTDMEASPEEISQAHLNIYDFLSDWIVRCNDAAASPPPGCIDEAALRCGLAIHQAAILDGDVDLDAVESPDGSPAGVAPDLFCLDTLPTDGCPKDALGTGFDYTDLFAMQEHNRFWQNLAQVLKYEADRARSDAFLTLFRNEVDPFAQGSALSYKADRLRDAIARYDEVLALVVEEVPATVLFRWPVRAFKQMGNDWLGILQAVASDRMDAVTELVDLERRVFATTDDDDYRFAHHMMQQEYLLQVYLMVLQARWQEELFAYRGEAGPILERGQHVLSKLNPVKNELGITSNQVFFENSNPDLVNWESYRAALVGELGGGGLVGDVRGEVGDAVDEMKSALSDLDSLEASIQESRLELQDTLNAVCGDPDLFDPSNSSAPDDYCQQLLKQFDDADDWVELRDCKFSTGDSGGDESTGASNDGSDAFTCPTGTEFTCATGCDDCDTTNCKEVVKTFVLGTDAIEPYVDDSSGNTDEAANPSEDIINNPPRCGYEGLATSISIQGVQRPCVGGEMGDVFAQKALVDRQRRIVIGSVQTLMMQIQATLRMKVKKKQLSDTKIGLEFGLFRPLNAALTFAIVILKNSIEGGEDVAVSAGCQIIAGFSFGTDCPQKVIAGIFDGTLSISKGLLTTALMAIQKVAAYSKDLAMTLLDRQIGGAEVAAEIESDLREIDGLIDEYNALTQESFNLYVQIRDLRFQAQAAADRFSEEVLFVAQHLVGRESGNLLLGEAMARDASAAFEDVLVLTYKMTMAFVHHYNVPPGEASNLVNEALALVTLDDVSDFVGKLDQRVQEYCGLEGIDCDASNNVEVLRYSLRDQIFPQLGDVVDARTGQVLTAGEQFHNTITSPPYLKRRFRGSQVVDQIEIPVPVPITARRNGPNGAQWLIDPLSCNHMLDARPPQNGAAHQGTLAVNVEGRNLGDGAQTVHYELVRGPTDFLRACSPQSVQTEIGTTPTLDYPIRTWTIGYAPVNPKAQQDDPPAYVSRSSSLSACINAPEEAGSIVEGNCWRYFARDRSLASLDWKLVIPLQVGDAATANAWVAGEGLSEEERPVIEDINLYFRYRARPIQEF